MQRRGHENAARWYAGDGSLVAALQHAVAAQDWKLCADLLCRGAFEQTYLGAATGTITGIGRFVDATGAAAQDDDLPDEVLAAQAAVAVAIGRYEQATALLTSLEPSRLSRGADTLHAYARLFVARQDGDAASLEEAATVLGDHDAHGAFGTFALYERGSLHLWQGSDNRCGHRSATGAEAGERRVPPRDRSAVFGTAGDLALHRREECRWPSSSSTEGAALLQANPWIPEEFRVAYHLGGAEVALMHGDLDLYSRFLRLVDAALAPKTDPALSYMQAQIQAKGLQNAGRYAEARDILLTDTGRELPSAWVLQPAPTSCSWSSGADG